MIERYTRPEMGSIWSDQSRYSIWLEVETLALEAMVSVGLAPQEALKDVSEKGAFDAVRVAQIESEVHHDVIAFLTNVAEHVGPNARFLHRGMTSSDLLDTTLAVQLKRSGELILEGLEDMRVAILQRAREFRYTPCIGRSHGIHAEPISFGVKLLSWYAEVSRRQTALERAIEEVSVAKLSGVVGTYASLPEEIEKFVAEKLGLRRETVATQVVSRDRHAGYFCALALLASSLERFVVELRHLQRTEVREVEEPFGSGQKGSSAMPHKKNPILGENLTGLARLVRSNSLAALENIALWHERDISHSSVERVIGPDCSILVDFMIHRFIRLVKGMVVHEDQMLRNLELSRGLIFSGTLLISLVDKGVSREDAYRLVQTHALPAWEGGAPLRERVEADTEIRALFSGDELEDIFSLERHLHSVDQIFENTLAVYPEVRNCK